MVVRSASEAIAKLITQEVREGTYLCLKVYSVRFTLIELRYIENLYGSIIKSVAYVISLAGV